MQQQTNLNLSSDKSNIVQAYGMLDQIKDVSAPVNFKFDVDGKTQEFSLSPEQITSWKTYLANSLFGAASGSGGGSVEAKHFSKAQVAQSLDIEPTTLDGLVAKQGAQADSFTFDEIMPWLSQQISPSGASDERRV